MNIEYMEVKGKKKSTVYVLALYFTYLICNLFIYAYNKTTNKLYKIKIIVLKNKNNKYMIT